VIWVGSGEALTKIDGRRRQDNVGSGVSQANMNGFLRNFQELAYLLVLTWR